MLKGHGGNLSEMALRFNVSPCSVIDFSASVHSPLPRQRVRQWAAEAMKTVGNYPDPEYRRLSEKLAEKYKVKKTNVMPGNGSSELLYLALRAFKPKKVLIVMPSYADYADASRFAGAKVESFKLDEKDSFRLDCAKLSAKAEKFDAVILGNPNNPTGGLIKKAELLKMFSKNLSTLFILDEAFIDFLPESESVAGSLKPNLIILRSLTKFYGIPGLRFGFAVAKPSLIDKLARYREPWSVNCVAECFAIKICGDVVDEDAERAKVARDGKRFCKSLSAISSLKVFKPYANFILARIIGKKTTAPKLQTALIKKGFLIRDCSNFEGLGPAYFRMSVRRGVENAKIVKAIEELLG